MKIFLASKSKRRIKILKKYIREFTVRISNACEETGLKKPSAIVKQLAERKAASVAEKYEKGIFLGFDTVVFHKGKILNKPRDAKDAEGMLGDLSGSWHSVYSGICVFNKYSGKSAAGYERSLVKFRELSPEYICAYSKRHPDKAGAYAVQEGEKSPVEKISGSYYNVVGFPEKTFIRLMRRTGYNGFK